MIDLRSDTVTRPSVAMRKAMASAKVGDDDYHDDPTVNLLEERAAEVVGKEAALFVPSGVMGNLIAALTHCPAHYRVIAGEGSHISWSLSGNQRIAGMVQLTSLRCNSRGVPEQEALRAELQVSHAARIGMVCYENTHNLAGGTALAPHETSAFLEMARQNGISIHLDGARLFNASVALNISASELTKEADSVNFCLSKGLGAPVGSMLCGSTTFIERARNYRKFLGGTMRQVGIVAAAGLFALDHEVDRLDIDHANAQWVADQLRQIPNLQVTPTHIETNIVFFSHKSKQASLLFDKLTRIGVATNQIYDRIRVVTHCDLTKSDLSRAVELIAEVSSDPTL